ncbi:hypothetical protein [Mucilaginibacter kameinonensis]|uniref:hypothetical protein n=1 Tax=Mucilaginibacter kameinonensis TaxID=452286 RepID=UPI0013CEDCF8|nr:hypothetical protein [Mucilaginibacter kameinonensis]
MDQYLQPNQSYLRLVDDYKKHGTLIVAFDFDNTVYDFHGTGNSYRYMTDLLRRCNKAGFYLICFTANSDTLAIIDYLKANDIPYNAINENPPFFQCDSPKVYYNILLDDRAGLIQAYTELDLLLRSIE